MRPIEQQKKALRKHYLSLRSSIGIERHARKSNRIVERLLELPEIQDASIIHAYWPLISKGEIDIRPLIMQLHNQGKLIALPVVLYYNDYRSGLQRLEHRVFKGETNLKANRWDIYEPVGTNAVPTTELDVIIVPALAVEMNGHRLGYGKGFYDELLAQASCVTVCPVFDECITEHLPHTIHDIPVDIIVSESGVFRLNQDAT